MVEKPARPEYADYKKRILDRYVDVLFGRIHDPAGIQGEYVRYARFCEKNYGAFLPRDRGASILDLGCGLGHFLSYLHKAGYRRYLGVDASAQLMEHCRKQGFNVVQGDLIEYVASTRERYDLVVLE